MKKQVFSMATIVATVLTAGMLTLVSCEKQGKVVSSETEMCPIDERLDAIQDSNYLNELAPIRGMLDSLLGEKLAVAPVAIEPKRPEGTMNNWASDALLAKARQYYPNGDVDMAVVNYGGIRCSWEPGDITIRHIYQLMPFENELGVLTMTGKDILELCQVFAMTGGEGVAGLRMSAEDKQLIDATIGGKEIVPEAVYHVATSDYLSAGSDKLTPLANHIEMWKPGLVIRDLYIEYAREQGTVTAEVDGRMDIR